MKIIEKLKLKLLLPLVAVLPFSMSLVALADEPSQPLPYVVDNSRYYDLLRHLSSYLEEHPTSSNYEYRDFLDKPGVVVLPVNTESTSPNYLCVTVWYPREDLGSSPFEIPRLSVPSGFIYDDYDVYGNTGTFSFPGTSLGSYEYVRFSYRITVETGAVSSYSSSKALFFPINQEVYATLSNGQNLYYRDILYCNGAFTHNGNVLFTNSYAPPLSDFDFNGHSNGFDYSDYTFIPDTTTDVSDPGWLKKIFNLLGKVNNNIIGALAQINNNINGLFAPLYTQINAAIDSITSPLNNLVNGVLNGFQSIGDKIDYLFEPLRLNDVIDAFYNTTVGGLVSSVDGFLDGFRDAFYNATEPETLVFDIPYDFMNIQGTIHIDFAWYKQIKTKYLNVFLTFLVMGFGIHILKTLPGVLGGMPKERSNK